MADLDDFFAKKDRKKANRNKKFATTEEIAKKLEETGKKTEKAKKDKPALSVSAPVQNEDEQIVPAEVGNNVDEDEWKEFEEEKKDYTGLKIGNLQLNDGVENSDEGASDDEHEMEENEAGEMVPRRKAQSGPWKMVSTPQQQDQSETRVTAEKPAAKTSGGLYISPGLRNLQAREQAAPSRLKSKTAPDISDEKFFPSLSAATSGEPTGPWGRSKKREDGNFEEVRNSKSHSSRYSDATNKTTGSGPKLSLGNKYGALSQDQS